MPYRITRRESLYLDLLRSLAALTVLIDHASGLFDFPWSGGVGHHAVMVFFVLSGYVISNVTDTRESNATAYLVARFARLWSVVFPALALTILCDSLGRHFEVYPGAYDWSPIDYPIIRLGAAVTFLAQSWVNIQPFSNFAFWSLSLEFWYYMVFAAWTFVPPGPKRTVAIAVALVFAGHVGIALLPIWLMGVALQRVKLLQAVSLPASIGLFIAGLVIFIWLAASLLWFSLQGATAAILTDRLFADLAQAKMFWFDWISGLAVLMHLIGARRLIRLVPIERIERPVRWCAGISFAAYLFHTPLLHLAAAVLPRTQGALAITLTILAIAALGPPVERSKRWWGRRLEPVVAWCVGRARTSGLVVAGS